ncbi:reverse transcriptase family protein [Acetobacter sp.]|uniref:reverse transcriptase family protein n=1 Tax=Acetobacter sp. TaxID=440 RepID=UPI0025B94367|nr:reverse transcriptase family protein [Acetobacter sp.]MCH4091857.1 reverse transcriptase family protein [Acetobacter sp.]
MADVLGITPPLLESVLAVERPYSERSVETGSGEKVKVREIQEPRGALRPIHERVATLLSRIDPPDFLFCPVKRRCYVSNAAHHVGSRHVSTLDIKTYFPATPEHRVFWFFNHVLQCERDVASILGRLLTVNGHLATGSPVSPILSFFAFYDMWNSIARVVVENGCKLSVYIDDITISGGVVPNWLLWEVKRQIHSRGLIYHKEHRYYQGVSEITGVIVQNGGLSLPNRQHQKAYLLQKELRRQADVEARGVLERRIKGMSAQRKQIEGMII